MSGGANEGAADRPRGLGPLVLLSAAVPAAAALAGLHAARPWTAWVLICVTLVQGVVAGALLPRFWHAGRQADGSASTAPPADAPPEGDPWVRRLSGAGGRYLLFLGAVAFGAVEAHAVGVGIARGAPRASLLLLVPPIGLAVWALRDALDSAAGSRGADTGGKGTA